MLQTQRKEKHIRACICPKNRARAVRLSMADGHGIEGKVTENGKEMG